MSAILLGGFLFFSVSIGGGMAWFVSKVLHNSNGGLSVLCGGFLVGLLALDIVPTALEMYKSFGITLGVLIGWIFFLLLRNLIHPSDSKNPSTFLLAVAILIHTIPISMTIGNLLGDSTLGVTLTTSTILHHLPEGFALASVLLSQNGSMWELLLFFIGLSVFFSVFIWIGHHSNLSLKAQSVLMGVSIGLIASTSVSEFILHNIRVVPIRLFSLYLLMGYLLSNLFHWFL